jgi:hypothetical protein
MCKFMRWGEPGVNLWTKPRRCDVLFVWCRFSKPDSAASLGKSRTISRSLRIESMTRSITQAAGRERHAVTNSGSHRLTRSLKTISRQRCPESCQESQVGGTV